MRLIITCFLLLLTNFSKSQLSTDTNNNSDTVCTATFPDGNQNIYRFINKNLKWPSYDPEYYAYGKVYVKFMVDTFGQVQNISILKGLDSLANKESLRVISLFPKWTPPDCPGRHSNIWYTLELNFKVQ
jgi:outer membrane biosynthesis protein TonB